MRARGLCARLSWLQSHCSADTLTEPLVTYTPQDTVLRAPDGAVEHAGAEAHALAHVPVDKVALDLSLARHIYEAS